MPRAQLLQLVGGGPFDGASVIDCAGKQWFNWRIDATGNYGVYVRMSPRKAVFVAVEKTFQAGEEVARDWIAFHTD